MKTNGNSIPISLLFKPFTYCLFWVLASIWTFKINAETILVVDQFGQPIENVVISFNENATSEVDLADVAIMDQINRQFSPRVLVIQKNQAVAFPNSDDTRHHIYSFSKPKPFEIKMYKGGDSKQLTFNQSGIVVLGCNIHDQMVGYIYVADNQHTLLTNAQGKAEIPTTGLAIQLWHSRLSADKITRKSIQLPTEFPEQPYRIVLNLLEEIKAPTTKTFRSKKSWKRK